MKKAKKCMYIKKYIMGDNLFQDYAYSHIELKAIEGNACRVWAWEQTHPKGVLWYIITEYESGYRKYWYSLFYQFASEMDRSYSYDGMRSYYQFKKKYFKYLTTKQKKLINKYEEELLC